MIKADKNSVIINITLFYDDINGQFERVTMLAGFLIDN